MDAVTILGLAAGFLTTTSFLPQVVKTWKTRSAHDLSYGMIVLFLSGIGLWFLYGVQIQSLPIMLANALTIVLLFILFGMKIRYS
ncbi:MAG: SemiSWEET transporter [Methanomicrobiales archaeon]|nr:SemiSWEET transporter [Methanomicrobiales archaeon]